MRENLTYGLIGGTRVTSSLPYEGVLTLFA